MLLFNVSYKFGLYTTYVTYWIYVRWGKFIFEKKYCIYI